jgi:DnaJ domain
MRPPQLRLDPQGLYARLDVEPSASPEAIVAAFRRKARVLHPDIAGTGDADAFVAVKLAYDVLAHPERRATYDRAARQAALDKTEPGEIPPSPVRVAQGYSRQPRVSDLPIAVWIGMVAVLCVGVVEVILHVRALPPPTRQVMIRPNAPIVAPATPEQSRALEFGPTPLRLAGTPNYYIVPASAPTVLWRRDAEHNAFVPAGQLPPFSSVQALRLFRQYGLVEVRVTDTMDGFVEAGRLTPGDAAAARHAYCAYNSGPTPADGEILERNGSGPGRLELDNRTTQPVVVKLRDQTGAVAASIFLAPGGHADVDNLPNARFRPDIAIGELWSRACNTFAAGMRAQRMAGFFSLDALTPLTIPPDLPGEAEPADIPDQVFEHE